MLGACSSLLVLRGGRGSPAVVDAAGYESPGGVDDVAADQAAGGVSTVSIMYTVAFAVLTPPQMTAASATSI